MAPSAMPQPGNSTAAVDAWAGYTQVSSCNALAWDALATRLSEFINLRTPGLWIWSRNLYVRESHTHYHFQRTGNMRRPDRKRLIHRVIDTGAIS